MLCHYDKNTDTYYLGGKNKSSKREVKNCSSKTSRPIARRTNNKTRNLSLTATVT